MIYEGEQSREAPVCPQATLTPSFQPVGDREQALSWETCCSRAGKATAAHKSLQRGRGRDPYVFINTTLASVLCLTVMVLQ